MKREDIKKLQRLSSTWLILQDDMEYHEKAEGNAARDGITFIEAIAKARKQNYKKEIARTEKEIKEFISELKNNNYGE